jgi:D-alanyl-lipoteichoic acid acyltransferase DltB (MBOAT superfamily)
VSKEEKVCMTDQNSSHRGTLLLVIPAALVIIIYGINQAQSVVALFLVSVFLALLGTPPVLWLERKRVPSFLAVMIVMAGMIALLFNYRWCRRRIPQHVFRCFAFLSETPARISLGAQAPVGKQAYRVH